MLAREREVANFREFLEKNTIFDEHPVYQLSEWGTCTAHTIRLFDLLGTGCSLNIVFFPQNVVIFLNWRWCFTCLVCVQGKIDEGQSPEYSKIFGKNTIFNEHPVEKWFHSQVTEVAHMSSIEISKEKEGVISLK